MTTISMNQSLENQFLHWCQDMERKQEEQARQMKELQGQAKCLWHENDQLRAQIEKSHKDAQDNGRNMQPIACNKGKGLLVPDNFDTLENDELSLGSSPSLNLSLAMNTQKSTRTRSYKRPSPHLTFSDAVSGASRRATKKQTEDDTGQVKP